MTELKIRQLETKWSPKKRTKFSESRVEINMGKQNEENAAKISSLDQLPVEILESIIAYVPQSDLPSCCVASKSLYPLVLKKLYSRIVFFKDSYIQCWASSRLPIETITNYATKLLFNNRWKFLVTIMSNKHIASLIKSFCVQEFEQENGFPEISHYISILLCHVNLDDFFCMNSALVPTNNLKSIQSMACHLLPHSGLYENLSELKILYDSPDFRNFTFDTLAHKIIDQNMHQKLRSLAIIYRNTFTRDDAFADCRPFWPLLFNVFVTRGVKLGLTSLSLSGEFWDSEESTPEITGEAVEVSKLESLEIEFAKNYR